MPWSDTTPPHATRVLAMLGAATAVAALVGLAPGGQGGGTPLVAALAHADAPDAAACEGDGPAFRELLEAVRAKAAELERREAALGSRERGLAAVRRLVAEEVTRLEALARTLGIAADGGAPLEIARVYEAMDAEDAARILAGLDDRTLRAVLGRMRERQVGAILAAMERERAVAVTKVLTLPAAPPSR